MLDAFMLLVTLEPFEHSKDVTSILYLSLYSFIPLFLFYSVLTNTWLRRGNRHQILYSSRNSCMTSGSAFITGTGAEGEFHCSSRGS